MLFFIFLVWYGVLVHISHTCIIHGRSTVYLSLHICIYGICVCVPVCVCVRILRKMCAALFLFLSHFLIENTFDIVHNTFRLQGTILLTSMHMPWLGDLMQAPKQMKEGLNVNSVAKEQRPFQSFSAVTPENQIRVFRIVFHTSSYFALQCTFFCIIFFFRAFWCYYMYFVCVSCFVCTHFLPYSPCIGITI